MPPLHSRISLPIAAAVACLILTCSAWTAWGAASGGGPGGGGGGGGAGGGGGGGSPAAQNGQFFASTSRLVLENASIQLRLLSRRLRGPGSVGEFGLAGTSPAFAFQDSTLLAQSELESTQLLVRGQCCDVPRSLWALGYGLGGEVQPDFQALGVEYALGGTQFGVEKALDECVCIGAFGGIANSEFRQDVNVASSDVEHVLLGGYLHKSDGHHYYLLSGIYGYDDYSSDRITGTGTALGSYHGHQAAAYLERGLSSCWNGFEIQPMGALQYTYVDQGGFTETGAGANNLTVGSISTHSFRGVLGGRAYWQRQTPHGLLAPDVHAQWIHEFLETATGVLVGIAPATSVRGVDPGRDFALVGVGTSLRCSDQLRLYAAYDVQLNSREVFHLGTAGFDWTW